ncbi:MAG: hypothetical protein HYW05_03760 [Candidatus Diapherotrites archaeon]|nr:hypothetical protein [Candidatus Diapherotrites archaeon]
MGNFRFIGRFNFLAGIKRRRKANPHYSGMLEIGQLAEVVEKDPAKRKLFEVWGYASELSEKRLVEKGLAPEAIKFFVGEGILIKLPVTFGGARYFLSQDRGISLLSKFKKE